MRYGPRLAVIIRCDLGQEFELNLDAGEYQAAPYPPKPLSKAQAEALGLKPLQFVASDKPTLRIETTTLDTGERKEFFGVSIQDIAQAVRKCHGEIQMTLAAEARDYRKTLSMRAANQQPIPGGRRVTDPPRLQGSDEIGKAQLAGSVTPANIKPAA